MGKKLYTGGEAAVFAPFFEISIWRITCQNDQGNGHWTDSRERLYGVGTSQIVLNCDDDKSGDSDFNDIVVKVQLGYNGVSLTGIVPVDNNTGNVEEKHGDGNFKQDKVKTFNPEHKKGKADN